MHMGRRMGKMLVMGSMTALMLAVSVQRASAFDVVEASIDDLFAAYATGETTATDVVKQYLDRIRKYDQSTGGINSVAAVNPYVFQEAAAADAAIKAAKANGTSYSPLLGVPIIIKDSYDVKGMTTTNGVGVLSPTGAGAVTNMIATTDAFSVAKLREAGAIIIGKASMSTMAYSYDGYDDAHGAVLNPYNKQRAPGGSSSGTGAAVASNFAMAGMGGETGGSIRVPANHNALVGLKTSAGLIDPGGTWPLTPSRDVVGPLTKTVSDAAHMMDALVGPSSTNLWNGTPFYPDAAPGTERPASYTSYLSDTALQGKVIAIPKNYAGLTSGSRIDPYVTEAFWKAVDVVRAQGATVIEVDIPATTIYNNTIARSTVTGFPYAYPTSATNPTRTDDSWSSWAAAYYYQKTIESYNDPNIKNLRDLATAVAKSPTLGKFVTESGLFEPLYGSDGTLRDDPTGAVANLERLATIWESGLAKGFDTNTEAQKALKAFADLRRDYYEAFMENPHAFDDAATTADDILSTVDAIDAFLFPTYGSISPINRGVVVDRDTVDPLNPDRLSYLSLNARFEANILGVPGVTVPMGYAPDGTPMGIEFMGGFLEDGQILGLAYDYEQASLWRMSPDAVPEAATLAMLLPAGLCLLTRRRNAVRA